MTKMTLSVGIPVHNEAKNIIALLNSIFSQKNPNFSLEKIIVVCDACTDDTFELVTKFAENTKQILILNDEKRKGKAVRLNQIHKLSTSDLLLTMDGDVIFATPHELKKLVQEMIENPAVMLVGPRYVPVKTKTLMGRFAEYSYLSFEEAILHLNDGNNIYALMGCASLIRKELTQKIKYPRNLISDQNYLYLSAVNNDPDSFKLCKEAKVLFRTVTTFQDWLKLSVRSIKGDKSSALDFFGEEVFKKAYYMPRFIYALAILKWFIRQPFYETGAVAMNIYIRVFPYTDHPVVKGIWEVTESSKETINV